MSVGIANECGRLNALYRVGSIGHCQSRACMVAMIVGALHMCS